MGILETLGLKRKKEDLFGDFDKELGLSEPDSLNRESEHPSMGMGETAQPSPPGIDESGFTQPVPSAQQNFDSSQSFPMQPQTEQFPQTRPQQSRPDDRDMEIVMSKLDAVKAILNSMDQRLSNIEHSLYGQETQKRYRW